MAGGVQRSSGHGPQPGPEHVREMVRLIGGYRISQSIYVAARLGIADLLADGALETATIARLCGADEQSLYRVLRLLAGVGVLDEIGQGAFRLTELGATLRSDVPGTPARNAEVQLHPAQWAAWGRLLESVRSGRTAFAELHGMSMFDFMLHDREFARLFDASMTANSERLGKAIACSYDLSDAAIIVDVGGGNGEVLASLLAAHPKANGILFERPHVVDGARTRLDAAGVLARCDIVSGDFFERVPSGASVYLLSKVLHDWGDAQAVSILERCRSACLESSRILVFERLLSADNVAGLPALHVDLEMLVNVGGKERTLQQYEALIATAGLCLQDVVPAQGVADHAIMVARRPS